MTAQHFGLIGFPLSHSFSPTFFAEKFARLHLLQHTYQAFPLTHIHELPILLQQQKLDGFNVTIPYKETVLPYLHTANDIVKAIGACNCVSIKNNLLYGYNTDVIGFEQSLLPLLHPQHQHALILGTGGAAKAVDYVLKQNNISSTFVSRTNSENALVYEALDKTLLKKHLLIINTSPLGMSPNTNVCPNIPYELITPEHLCYDLIYNPTETLFLRQAKMKGAKTKNGYEMLLLQAEESWRIWNQEK